MPATLFRGFPGHPALVAGGGVLVDQPFAGGAIQERYRRDLLLSASVAGVRLFERSAKG